MAKIVENPTGGRRSIRLTPDDVAMVISAYQLRTKALKLANYTDLKHALEGQPIYLPEDL